MAHDRDLWNKDLAPTTAAQRTWSMWHVAALWVGMAVCIPTYMMAADMVKEGFSVGQSIAIVALGNVIVLVPMLLNAHPGTKYGIPFPVLARASFGWRGANVAAIARALVACGWFGIQSWIGGGSLHMIVSKLGWPGGAPLPGLGINEAQLVCFLGFWAINVYFVWKGVESIKWLESLAAPFLLVGGTALLVYVWASHGTGALLDKPGLSGDAFWKAFGPSLTGMVAFWSTLALNIPDFSRYCRSQKDQILGQSIALPTTMAYFSFIGAAVASATGIWDPTAFIGSFSSPIVIAVGVFGLTLATLSTNLAANLVSPANDFSNLAPAKISYRMGGYITAGLGLVMMPWKLMNNYVFGWLNGYGALLGAVGGVMIADYWLVRKRELIVDDLYRKTGTYAYRNGWNPIALVALVLGVLPNLPGFLHAVSAVDSVPTIFDQLYAYTWFISFGISGAVYTVGMRLTKEEHLVMERDVSAITAKHTYGTWRAQKGWKPIHVTKAEGVYFWDKGGKRYLDMSSQLVCSNLGHQNQAVIDAICEQAQKLAFISPAYTCDVRADLSEKLLEVMPKGIDKFFYATSGTEANEAAIKIARLYTGRSKIIARYRSYHGSTSAGMAATGDFRRWSAEPVGTVPWILHAPEANAYKCPLGHPPETCGVQCADYIGYMIDNENDVAAVIIEPIVGTNGVLVPPKGYLPRLAEVCKQRGVLLIADEVMSGWGRTGSWFAVDHWGVTPDILVTAKGLTNAMAPLGVCATSRAIADHFEENFFAHGHTYEAHPLTMAPAIAAIAEYKRLNLIEKAKVDGEKLGAKLRALKDKHPSIGDVRGMGMFWAIDLVSDRATKQPFNTYRDKADRKPLVVDAVVADLLARGVVAMGWVSHLVIAPPLIITDEQVDEAIAALDAALSIADAKVATI